MAANIEFFIFTARRPRTPGVSISSVNLLPGLGPTTDPDYSIIRSMAIGKLESERRARNTRCHRILRRGQVDDADGVKPHRSAIRITADDRGRSERRNRNRK